MRRRACSHRMLEDHSRAEPPKTDYITFSSLVHASIRLLSRFAFTEALHGRGSRRKSRNRAAKGSHLHSEALLLKGPEPGVVLFIKRYPKLAT